MQLPSIYKNSSKNIQNIIIQLGSSLFNYLDFNNMSEEDIMIKYNSINKDILKEGYEKQIQVLKNENEKNKNHYEKEVQGIHSSYGKKINNEKEIQDGLNKKHREQLNLLREEILSCENSFREKFRKEFDDKYEESVNHIKKIHSLEIHQKDTIIQEKQKEIDVQYNKIEPLLNKLTEKKDFNNSTEQGNYGEGLVDEIVKKGLPFDTKAEIEDSSKKGGSGDRIIRFNNGNVLMIEVKNEKTIDKHDREQFQEHSRVDFEESKCDSSLFLSLRSQQIPKIGKTVIPIYDNKMIYYGLDDDLSLLEKKEKIIKCIEEIYEKLNHKENLKTKEPTNNIFIYNQCLENLNNQKNDYEEIIRTNEKNTENYNKKLSEINKKLNQIYREIQNKNIHVDERLINDKLYVHDFIERIKLWKNEKNIILKNPFRQKIIEEMELSELDKTMIKKIKLTDLQ